MATCAVDGMCATQCPVDINTGDLVKRLRQENHSTFQNKLANRVANHFNLFEFAAKSALTTGFFLNRFLGKRFMKNFTSGIKRIIPAMPVWSNQIRKPAKKIGRIKHGAGNEQVVYFPSCISRMMGGDIIDVFLSVCQKAKINVIIPA